MLRVQSLCSCHFTLSSYLLSQQGLFRSGRQCSKLDCQGTQRQNSMFFYGARHKVSHQDELNQPGCLDLTIPASCQECFCSDLQQAIETHLESQSLRLPRIHMWTVHVDQGQGLLLPFQCAGEKRAPPPKEVSFKTPLPYSHHAASS